MKQVNEAVSVKTVALSTVARDAIADAVSKTLAGDRAMSKAADALQADGVKAAMLYAPKEGADRTFYESVQAAVVMGFSKTIQDLIVKNTKTLSEEKKAEKRYWIQQKGSKTNDLRDMLERREAYAKAQAEGSSGANVRSTLESRILRDLAKYLKQLGEVENFKGDLLGLQKDLKSAIARIK